MLIYRTATRRGDAEFNGIIPVNPETLTLFGKLYGEVAAIFPSTYLHGGCDEVNWGGSLLSRKALQVKGRARVWAEYLNSLNEISAGLGKQLIVWGDFVVHKEPEVLGQLNKKIIIMDWNYSDNSSAKFLEAFQKVSANGSRGIGAPALTCYKWGARVGTEQLRNVDACVDAYSATNDPNIPGRYCHQLGAKPLHSGFDLGWIRLRCRRPQERDGNRANLGLPPFCRKALSSGLERGMGRSIPNDL